MLLLARSIFSWPTSRIVSTSPLAAANGRGGPCSGQRTIQYSIQFSYHIIFMVCLGLCRIAKPIPLHARPQPKSPIISMFHLCLEHLVVDFFLEPFRLGQSPHIEVAHRSLIWFGMPSEF
ncbi:hypothetical protein PoB_003053400 [Plakobranchus ocellatus]|uniref:Uncharacterized protein n=1 Tax=Plakobranchus ocellatus TaxID=259542 RepID=A0AAV4AC77_9GAST|nr:hypothetical protein PoB_003053400 [Plakobranchus ocellatus]